MRGVVHMIAYYGTEISPNQIQTEEGFLICKNVPIARTGKQIYLRGELGLEGDTEEPVEVYRSEDEVFSPAAMASFEGKPITDGHPPEQVIPENFSAYSKGHIERVHRDGDFLVADLYVNDPNLANDIQGHIKRDVSCGYNCFYVPMGKGYKQEKIRGNHVAVVPNGRAGHMVSIKDNSPEPTQTPKKGGKKEMKKTGNILEDFLNVFGMATKDATPEAISDMAKSTAAMIGSKEEPKADDANDVMVERAPKGDDLGTKLDKLIEMMESVMEKNDREEKMERKATGEDDLHELIERMAGGEETAREKEDAVTIPMESMEDACRNKDSIVQILKTISPAVAAIKDADDRKKVTDALVSSIRGNHRENQINGIVSAAADSARNAKAISQEKVIAEQQKAYNARNPHKNND